ncbi:tryptophan synthase subunit alpha [Chloracidobacterium aggregatum]|jgi:tryptophan synthase alpha chain|uniref:Tryptophan synthase alpha chain n=1 Tax=Chloracidobacterium sp. N TaxID=2821540 RepID=A0ABX8B3S2_9BACT|nr:tryptophan synthase subunit alpha [Chloracidobacterium aggregatum]QUV86201.1 tryptophan synthase subunit alpha [Chloracidobacterium sp. 2]QUV89353.1 tryptophan synthase subunit alpha [Chloracidobacterium sp. S]QUV92643.1 tryptophan synthase subunit alpha [Chloracidobacterium sp. A]QUV95118.1 tryptophan synthase subunit alpha [Chloracidobacterium sp. N]QUV98328.1 tryptophan synthase subunit alpha [Chloracidobacterium sp. E]
MNRYAARFAALRQAGRKAFIPFTVLGFPDRARCLASIEAMLAGGATALELGIAFSDPIADGPVIQQATHDVLASGFGVHDALALIAQVRQRDADIPIGLLVYHNTVAARGAGQFFADVHAAGADGVLIADLPPEMAAEMTAAARQAGIAPIFMVSPLTDAARLQRLAALAEGFLYVVSRLGITGSQTHFDDQLRVTLERARAVVNLPLCVGFGVSTPAAAQHMVALGADGVITGSRIIEIIRAAGEDFGPAVEQFCRTMQAAVDGNAVQAV